MALYDELTAITLGELILRGVFSLGIIIIGVLLGKILSVGLKKLSEKLDMHKHVKVGFIDLTLLIVRWSIYLVFINLALDQLAIPTITHYFSAFLIAIPSFTGGLLLLILGFAFAFYLKKVIKTSEEGAGWEFISQAVFFFVLIIFGVYALRIALTPIAEAVRNTLIGVIITICSAGAVYFFVQRELKKHKTN